jgi:hypothetical protein
MERFLCKDNFGRFRPRRKASTTPEGFGHVRLAFSTKLEADSRRLVNGRFSRNEPNLLCAWQHRVYKQTGPAQRETHDHTARACLHSFDRRACGARRPQPCRTKHQILAIRQAVADRKVVVRENGRWKIDDISGTIDGKPWSLATS